MEWAGLPASDATWKPVPDFKEVYPSFQLAYELFPEGERSYGGNTYQHWRQQGGELWRLGLVLDSLLEFEIGKIR
jgi:hypothetical protein